MKRRTILLLLVPTTAVVAAALIAGWFVAARLPTPAEVAGAESIEDSRHIQGEIRRLEAYLTICLTVAELGVVFAAAVVISHVSKFPRVREWRARVFESRPFGERERLFLTAVLVVALTLTGLMLLKANGRNLSPAGEEISVLETAIETRERHGAAGFAGALYAGRWQERELHPLHIWFLVPLASRSIGFFVQARLVSTILAAAGAGVVLFVSWRLFGMAAAVLVAVFYSLNSTFIQGSSTISAQGLLVPLSLLSVYFTLGGFERRRLLAAAGALAGLAYMTALSGLFLPVAFALTALLAWGVARLTRSHWILLAAAGALAAAALLVEWFWLWLAGLILLAAFVIWWFRAFRETGFYLYVFAFAVAASPLLVGNTIRYGNPFSDYRWSLAWLDRRQQADTMAFAEGETGLGRYLNEHRPVDIVTRLFEGGEMVLNAAANASSPTRQLLYTPSRSHWRFPLRLWLGRLVLVAAAVLALMDTDKMRRNFMWVLALVVFTPMAWQISVSPWLGPILPFVPLVLGYFAVGAVGAFGRPAYRVVIVSIAGFLAFSSAADSLNATHLLAVHRPPEDAVRLAEWFEENLEPGGVFLMGPDDDLRFGWYHDVSGRRENVPGTPDVPSLAAASRERNARYVVISKGLFAKRHLQFSGWVRLDNADLRVDGHINGWKPVFEDPVGAVDYIVFEVDRDDEGGGG